MQVCLDPVRIHVDQRSPIDWWKIKTCTEFVQVLRFGHAEFSSTDHECYDDAIMMSRTQVKLDQDTQRRARRRASDLGVSLAEYFRRLVARDLTGTQKTADVERVFDLGSSGGSDVAREKDAIVGEAVRSLGRRIDIHSQ